MTATIPAIDAAFMQQAVHSLHSQIAASTATYKTMLRREKELPLSNSSQRPAKLSNHHAKMASFCSTSSLTTSASRAFVPYVPPPPKPRAKPKPKSTKTAQTSYSGVGSSKKDGDWFHTDNFPMSNSSTSIRSLPQAVDVSVSVEHGITHHSLE